MANMGIFYGSTTGNTERAARLLHEALGAEHAALHDVAEASREDLARYDALILGVSTWGLGELEANWAKFLARADGVDLTGKKVALFGLGDQLGFPESFVDGLRKLYDFAAGQGAEVIGAWPADGYKFARSAAVVDGAFVGLVLDEDRQQDQTAARIEAWANQLREALL